MNKIIGWDAYEVIGIGLPNLYKCVNCGCLVNYSGMLPSKHVCAKCDPSRSSEFEKRQERTLEK